jgi:hypothetical protein
MPNRDVQDFISHWSAASPSERANSQTFLLELCDLLDVPRPDPHPANGYFFEFPVTEIHPDGTTSDGRIDLYKRAGFILESKQFQDAKAEQSRLELAAEEIGAISKRKKSVAPVRDTDRWDDAMLKALVQAQRYARALPAGEPYPPFLLVVDVGHAIEIRADFSLTGRSYLPFPDPLTYRIRLDQLRDEKIRARLKLIWTQPLELDPASHSAAVTREVAKHLAELAKSFEQAGHKPKIVAEFLTRCLFCMFAEDVGLLPDAQTRGFTELLESLSADDNGFEDVMRTLFREMNTGTGKSVSVILRRKLLQFNGGLFADDSVLPVNGTQLGILKAAARLDWQHVEPAIFGTLLERALGGEGERHKLGAHFTPRAYVERLVLATIIEPLRAEWESVRAAAVALGKRGDIEAARQVINRFHKRLCELKILDPACGCGNFLYVSLEHLKRLEGEVLDFVNQFGESFRLEMTAHTVDPHQFLGLEINPRAAAITEMVLWIGYLQWHFRTRGQTPPREPVLKKFDNIQCRDAVLDYDGEPQPALDPAGKPITVWDRSSKKKDSLTGREVPDETKRVPLFTYKNPRPAIWPAADFIVGNPPFIGNKRIRDALGDGYAVVLRSAYPNLSETADFVMYWWHKAAELVRLGKVRRFGLITTNSLRMLFNSRVVQTQLTAKPPLSLAFAIPDHPWVDTADGAAVRIAMTVGIAGIHSGELLESIEETPQDDGSVLVKFATTPGRIQSDITIGVRLSESHELTSNSGLSFMGVIPVGLGFVLEPSEIPSLGFKLGNLPPVIRPYLNGRDLTGESRAMFIIDFFGLTQLEARQKYPSLMQIVIDRVKSFRDTVARKNHGEYWWIYGEARPGMRKALAGLPYYIGTAETAKHRCFQFVPSSVLPDQKIRVIASSDAFVLGVLSSRAHVCWALAIGGTLEDRPVYNNTTCFDRYPFPLCGEAEKERIRKLAEELDAHRKRVQARHGLTLTGLYNVLAKIRAGEKLTDKEKLIHDAGLVSVLKQLHDDLDAAVFAAYGWPATLTDAEILERLVALNTERAAEEKRGIIHWLRPDYQAKSQKEMILPEREGKPAKKSKTKTAKLARKSKSIWPKTLAERVQTVETALHHLGAPASPADLAKQFKRAKPADVAEILETLLTLGRARKQGGKFSR